MSRSMIKCAMMVLACVGVLSCGNDIEPVKEFYDYNGHVFLEKGKTHPATTQFTTEELQRRLTSTAWMRNYAFYYDKTKAGTRKDGPAFYEQNYFVFSSDGTAYMGDVINSHSRTDFSYTISGRNVNMEFSSATSSMKVVAIDDTLMVVDSALPGQHIYGYDEETVVQRTVFVKYNRIN